MIRLLFSLFVSVVVARWMYSEVALSFPQAVPIIDYALEAVSIPTHDRWDSGPIRSALSALGLGDDTVAQDKSEQTVRARQRRPLKDVL